MPNENVTNTTYDGEFLSKAFSFVSLLQTEKNPHLAYFRKKEHNDIDTGSCIPDQTRCKDERL